MAEYRILDLFCGAGGFSYGMEKNPQFKTVIALDNDEYAGETFKRNMPETDVVIGDITNDEIKKQIAVNKEKIDAKKLKIGRLITRELENAIDKELAKWARDVQENDRVLSDVEISKNIIQYVNPILEREINKFVQDLIDGYKAQNIDGLRLALNAGGIRKERKTVSHTYTEVYYSSRSPEGVVEHIRSFFGKSYYVRRSRERTVNKTIDLGTNIDEYAERIIPMVRDALQQHVERNLDSIRDRYFLPQEKYADTMLARLAELEKELLTYRFLDVEGC